MDAPVTPILSRAEVAAPERGASVVPDHAAIDVHAPTVAPFSAAQESPR